MRIAMLVAGMLVVGHAYATLPPASDEAKAKAAEAKAKSAWADKVGAYQLCLSQDRVAQAYRKTAQANGKPAPQPVSTAPCTDPGPFATSETQKPLEASGAHSPSGTAKSPPSSNAPAADLMGASKK
jgi:hypothetical protein